MSPHHIFLLTLSLLAIISNAFATSRSLDVNIGGYTPIKDLNDPHVQEVAKFAISEHNKEQKEHLELVKIVKGESQVVAGTNYRLTLEVNDSHKYEAIVYEKPWQHYRSLTSFAPISV